MTIEKKILDVSTVHIKNGDHFFQTDIDILDQFFDISPLKEERFFVHDSCWLAGGSLLRWLSSNGNPPHPSSYDRDFFFPTRHDLVTTFETMLLKEFRINRFNFSKRKIIHRTCLTAADCPILRDYPEKILASRKIVNTLLREDLIMVELQSPRGLTCQLIAGYNGNSPLDIIQSFDYSISKFIIDKNSIYAGENTWKDMCNRTIRYTGKTTNIQTAWRMYKFIKMGYRPTLFSILMSIKSLLLIPKYVTR